LVATLQAQESIELTSFVRSGVGITYGEVAVDLTDEHAVGTALAAARPDVIIHAAGRVPGTPFELFRDNTTATVVLANAVLKSCRDTILICLGSAAEYGLNRSPDRITETYPCLPRSVYGYSKWAASQYLLGARRDGLRLNLLRVFNLIDEINPTTQVIGAFIAKATAQLHQPEPIVRMGRLDAIRDFVVLDDLIRLMIKLIERGTSGELINVCSGQGHRLRDLLQDVASRSSPPIRIVEPGEVPPAGHDDIVIGDPTRFLRAADLTRPSSVTETLARAWERAITRTVRDNGSSSIVTLALPTAKQLRNRKRVGVQGLGFVGAANAIAISSARDVDGRPLYDVIGVDLPTEAGRERVAALDAGRFPFATTDAKLVAAAAQGKASSNLSATTDVTALTQSDVIVVDVGLDLQEKGHRPTFQRQSFEAAITSVGKHMRADTLVLLESTVPPGTCERIVAPILQHQLAVRGLPSNRLKLAYCYERVMPGSQYLDSIVQMWRVYAGLTSAAADSAEAFLSSFTNVAIKPLRRLASLRAAEIAKVIENTYRAVNIALIDEWEKFARRIDIDLFEVLDAIRVRPTHRNIRYPGLGVGGYCLSKDPLFGAGSARELFGFEDLTFPLSFEAVRINDTMPKASANLLTEAFQGGLAGKSILILGASYREDVGDTRQSPAATLARILLGASARVELADPMVEALPEIPAPLHRKLPPAQLFDAVVLAVAHKEYRTIDLAQWAGLARPFVLDSNGVLSREKLEMLARTGFRVAAIGRGRL
jgi:nucleotide sugar dehydrogenase